MSLLRGEPSFPHLPNKGVALHQCFRNAEPQFWTTASGQPQATIPPQSLLYIGLLYKKVLDRVLELKKIKF